jgi:hypothetical protein
MQALPAQGPEQLQQTGARLWCGAAASRPRRRGRCGSAARGAEQRGSCGLGARPAPPPLPPAALGDSLLAARQVKTIQLRGARQQGAARARRLEARKRTGACCAAQGPEAPGAGPAASRPSRSGASAAARGARGAPAQAGGAWLWCGAGARKAARLPRAHLTAQECGVWSFARAARAGARSCAAVRHYELEFGGLGGRRL